MRRAAAEKAIGAASTGQDDAPPLRADTKRDTVWCPAVRRWRRECRARLVDVIFGHGRASSQDAGTTTPGQRDRARRFVARTSRYQPGLLFAFTNFRPAFRSPTFRRDTTSETSPINDACFLRAPTRRRGIPRTNDAAFFAVVFRRFLIAMAFASEDSGRVFGNQRRADEAQLDLLTTRALA
jgi:hypothetical protein